MTRRTSTTILATLLAIVFTSYICYTFWATTHTCEWFSKCGYGREYVRNHANDLENINNFEYGIK